MKKKDSLLLKVYIPLQTPEFLKKAFIFLNISKKMKYLNIWVRRQNIVLLFSLRQYTTPGVHFIKVKRQFQHFSILNTKIQAYKKLLFGHLECLLFGILNANISKTNANFWHFKRQKCFMKLSKSYTPFLAFKRHIFVF